MPLPATQAPHEVVPSPTVEEMSTTLVVAALVVQEGLVPVESLREVMVGMVSATSTTSKGSINWTVLKTLAAIIIICVIILFN